jgi:putative membrane protein
VQLEAPESAFAERALLEKEVIVMSEKEKPQLPLTNEHTEASTATMDLRILASLVRTAFSSEQSLMSWIRTSVSLFTFGFSINQFFHYLEKQQVGTQFSASPRRLGLTLICLGVLALVLAMLEHVQRLRTLQNQGLPRISRYLLPLGSAVALLVIGIAALIVSLN